MNFNCLSKVPVPGRAKPAVDPRTRKHPAENRHRKKQQTLHFIKLCMMTRKLNDDDVL